MAAKKPPKFLASAGKIAAPRPLAITNCNFEASWQPANEHARAAVEALARAAEANAHAIQEAARILAGGNLDSMVKVGN